MILVATPTRDVIHGSTTYDLVYLLRESPDAIFSVAFGTYLNNLRAQLVKAALAAGADHVLFVDSDMRFPANTLKRLVAHDQAIVGANCRSRTKDCPTARRGDCYIDSSGKHGLEAVDVLGFGVTLISINVFHSLPQPWFAMPWDGTKHTGEDVFFCHQAQEAGFKIMVDHDLSQQVKHIGAVELAIG